MNYSLKSASAADKPWLDHLRRECYKDLFDATWGHWDEDRHLRHFSSCLEKGNIQIIEYEDAPIGMLQVFDIDGAIEISEIQISPEHQGKGLGSTVIGDIIQKANESKKKVALSTGLKNEGAFRLYKELGFEETRRTDAKVYMEYFEK